MLSELGLREEALAAAKESADIRRKLAADRPDAFLPELARSLGVLCTCYTGLGQHERAKEAIEEALRKLSPFFLRLPEAFGPLMEPLVGDYLRSVKACGERPDMDLLEPVLTELEKLGREGRGK
jgi:tetratricopeptide (TPR) repeat protein